MKQRLRLLLLRFCGLLLRLLVPSRALVTDEAPEILVLRPDHLGDLLLSRPAIELLERKLPGARITVAVGSWGRPALGEMPLDRLLICPFPGFSRTPVGRLYPYALLLHYSVLLRRRPRYAMVVVLRSDHWWGALLGCLAGIPVRVGYDTPETTPFLTVALPHLAGTHAAAEALTLAEAAIGCMRDTRQPVANSGEEDDERRVLPVSATERDRQQVASLLATAGIAAGTPLLVLHPAAGSPLKSWPIERFAQAGTQVAAAMKARVAVTGAPHEGELAAQLCQSLPEGALNLAGALGWGELEALLARAALVIGVDSGPLHLAVAAGTPSLALFGPADPARFGPWGPAARHQVVAADLPCRPCGRLDYCQLEPDTQGPPPCMRGISVAMVVDAALALIQEGR